MHLKSVNQKLLQLLQPEEVEADIIRAEVTKELEEAGIEKSELDEMWSFVGKKVIRDGFDMQLTAVLTRY